MKTPPVEGWVPTRVTFPVAIPDREGTGVAETVETEVDAWRDPSGEIFLDGDAREKLDAVKARHMGLLTPAEIRQLREALQLTQDEISGLLQIGAKTWSRWENGRERPSRSLNLLLQTLADGRVDVNYLRLRAQPVRADAFLRVRALVSAEARMDRAASPYTDKVIAATFACTPADEAIAA